MLVLASLIIFYEQFQGVPCLCHFEITISQTILCALNTITI